MRSRIHAHTFEGEGCLEGKEEGGLNEGPQCQRCFTMSSQNVGCDPNRFFFCVFRDASLWVFSGDKKKTHGTSNGPFDLWIYGGVHSMFLLLIFGQQTLPRGRVGGLLFARCALIFGVGN